MLNNLFKIVKNRKEYPKDGSYTNRLLDAGYEGIAQKVGEEAIEVIIAAGKQGRQRVIEESADLLYHLLVLLVEQEIDLNEIETELESRHFGEK